MVAEDSVCGKLAGSRREDEFADTNGFAGTSALFAKGDDVSAVISASLELIFKVHLGTREAKGGGAGRGSKHQETTLNSSWMRSHGHSGSTRQRSGRF